MLASSSDSQSVAGQQLLTLIQGQTASRIRTRACIRGGLAYHLTVGHLCQHISAG